MVADPRFETLAILKLVVKQALDGDVSASDGWRSINFSPFRRRTERFG